MSNHIERAYISQWYGANGVRRSAALARIAAAAGPAGSERTSAPVPAWAQRWSSASRIVPKRSVPALNTAGPAAVGGEQADRRQVVGVDELVAVGAVAEHDRVGAVGDPVEQDPEDAEPAVAEDRPRPHDRHVEPGGGGAQAGPLGGQLGVAVGLLRAGHRGRQHRVGLGDAEHGARRRVHDLGRRRRRRRRRGAIARAVDVDRAQQPRVAGQRHLGDVVEHDVDAVDGGAHRSRVADVGGDDLDALRRRRR